MKRCKHCKIGIVKFHDSWMHQPAGTTEEAYLYSLCRLTKAEPEEEFPAVSEEFMRWLRSSIKTDYDRYLKEELDRLVGIKAEPEEEQNGGETISTPAESGRPTA